MHSIPRPRFEDVKHYAKLFTNAEYWSPYVHMVCEHHQLVPCSDIKAGFPGTNPVFIVDGRYAVKLYTDWFNGYASYPTELDSYRLIAMNPQLPAPALIAHGSLYPEGTEWHWPYIVTTVIPGASLGEAGELVSYDDRRELAGFLAQVLRQVHALPVESSAVMRRSWDSFAAFLQERRLHCLDNHRRWKALPDHLIDQIEDYLIPLSELMDDEGGPYILHCDLNRDHVLGAWEGVRWTPAGIIDFGDARAGDRLYEFVALHLGLFRYDKRLLGRFLTQYGVEEHWKDNGRLVRRLMNYTLLHEFNVLDQLCEAHPSLREAASLPELAAWIWDLGTPSPSPSSDDGVVA